MKKSEKDQALAAFLTFLTVLVILLVLFFGSVSWDRQALAESSTPEIMSVEETFIEPELVDLGEEVSQTNDKPAPTLKGEPDPAPKDNADIIEPGRNPTRNRNLCARRTPQRKRAR